MKQRLPFTGKICALMLGCLLVWGGIKAQPVYWSQPGAPYNPLKNAHGPGAIAYSGIVVYEAYYDDSLNSVALAQWDGYSWITYALPDTFDLSEGFESTDANMFCMSSDNYGTLYIAGPFRNQNGAVVIKWNNGTWGICGYGANGINQTGQVLTLCNDHAGLVYASFSVDSGAYAYQLIKWWNGTNWAAIPKLAYEAAGYHPTSGSSTMAIDGSNNLYAVGSYYSGGQYSFVYQYLYKYNGTSWVTVADTPPLDDFYTICGSNSNIYFELSNGTIGYCSGGQLTALPLIPSPYNQIVTMQTDHQGNLYVAGYLTDSAGGTFVDKWNGTSWKELGTNNFALHGNGFIQNMAVVGPDNVYVSGYFTNSAGNYYVAESSPLPNGRLFDYLTPTQANCVNNGYVTSTVYGGTAPYAYAWSNGQTTANCDSLPSGTYFVTVTDAHGLITTGEVFVPAGCQTIVSGNVFVDTDGRCLYNGNQAGLSNVTLGLSGDNQTLYATTDVYGSYSFVLSDTGNYHLYVQVGNSTACGNFTLCGNPSQVIHVGVLGDNVTGNNFALKPDPSSFDLYLHPGWTRGDPGFEKDYWVYFANSSPVPFSGSATVAFKYDPNLTFVSSDIPYSSYDTTTDSITWVVNNFNNNGWNFIGRVRFNVPSNLQLGYQLHSQFWIYPDAGDCDTSNNYLQYYETVKGSHDPNYKEVSPTGYSTAADSVLTYTIHYQNTGTDSTYFIVVKDTLSSYLNPATVRNLASSDRYSSFSISGTGVLTWTFLPLSLPAASTDSMASNGFITFSVNRMANTPTGTHITNTASVYFDYNSPVRTNTVTDTVSCTDTISQFGALCAGDSVYFYGRWIHTPGSYDTLLVRNPCDTFVTIGIVVQDPLPPHNISDTICANDSLLFASTYLHASGTYSHIGCDSSVRLHLIVLPVPVNTVTAVVCWDNPYLGHDTTGQYIDTFTMASGCDSIRILNLTVMPGTIIYDTVSICAGQTYLGHNATDNYTDTITGINSCDKLRHLNLTVRPPLSSSTTATVCQGQLYQGHGSTGTYTDTLIGTGGCDSIVTLQLTVLPVQQTTIHQSICSGASYNFNDSLLTLTGVYSATIAGANGCDSVVTLHLTVNPHPIQPFIIQQGDTLLSSDATGNQWYLNDTALAGDTSNLLIVAQHGSYQVEVTGPNGCQNISAGYLYAPTGISSLSNVFDVLFYPNPNSGLFTIEFSDYTAKEIVVTDMLGQTVFPTQTVITKGEFDLSTLAGGLYFLKIKEVGNTNRMVFKQVVIQH